MKKLFSTAMVVGLACVAGACAHNSTQPLVEDQPRITMKASNQELVVGDTTTLTIASTNTLGREADVEWTSTGGKLTTEDNRRVARVMFDAPGTYTVTARLMVNRAQMDTKSMNFTVRPVKGAVTPAPRD